MKIPAKLQVFERPVVVSSKDEQRLSPYLSGWMKLHTLLNDLNESDLRRLVIMELAGKKRTGILDRLLGRLSRVTAVQLDDKIARYL